MAPKPDLLRRTLSTLGNKAYVCPSCRLKASIPVKVPRNRPTLPGRRPDHRPFIYHPFNINAKIRHASTSANVTSINAKKDIPPGTEEIYHALAALEYDAGIHVNLSQLRLALRGLESQDAVTRIAILGIEDQAGACRLARVLLADPLAAEQEWEKALIDDKGRDEKAIMLRYGHQFQVDNRHPLVKTLSIPSKVLQDHKLEIFVQGIPTNGLNAEGSVNSLLVPALETATAAGGRLSAVTYPVHKSLIYGSSLDNSAPIGQVTRTASSPDETSMVKGAIDGSWNNLRSPSSTHTSIISAINLNLAELGIDNLRRSLERSFDYEHAWYDSGLPALSTWLTEGTSYPDPINQPLKPTIQHLIEIVTSTAISDMQSIQRAKAAKARAAAIPQVTRDALSREIDVWAEQAHTELRDRLSSAFASKSWKRIGWYKLFWRVDDVSATLSEILQKAWLVDAEKAAIWLCGRFRQAGLQPLPQLIPPASSNAANEDNEEELGEKEEKPRLGAAPLAPTVRDVLHFAPVDFSSSVFDRPMFPPPYPNLLLAARARLASLTIPTMQSLAQSLVIQALATTSLSTGISALLYVSVSATSVYEAGVVAAVGTVWGLWRLQGGWREGRRGWEETLREDGREILGVVEREMRGTVNDGGMEQGEGKSDGEDEELRKARAAVERVEDALSVYLEKSERR